MSVFKDLPQGSCSAELSSNDDDVKLLQGCTIISLPCVTPGWIIGVGVLVFSLSFTDSLLLVGSSPLIEMLLAVSELLTDHPELSDDWLAPDKLFEPSCSVSMQPVFAELTI